MGQAIGSLTIIPLDERSRKRLMRTRRSELLHKRAAELVPRRGLGSGLTLASVNWAIGNGAVAYG